MQNNQKHKLKLIAQKHVKEHYDYYSGVHCPECQSHYLRNPDEQEFRRLVNLKKVNKKDYNYTYVCCECDNLFVERFEDNDPEFLINEELYYAKNNVYE